MNEYMDETVMETREYHFDNVLDVLDWMGKTPAEAGLDAELSAGDGLVFKGFLFGKKIYGGTVYMGLKQKADVFDRVIYLLIALCVMKGIPSGSLGIFEPGTGKRRAYRITR